MPSKSLTELTWPERKLSLMKPILKGQLINNKLKSLIIGDLTIPVPIIQGGMGVGISLSGLASAVANMGGIGIISTVGIGLARNDKTANYRKNNIEAIREEIG